MSALCIGEPVSWLRLEQLALAELAPAVTTDVQSHLASCPACRAAFARIADDARPLPRLPAAVEAAARAPAARAPWWRRWQLAGTGFALAAAAVVLFLVVRRPDSPATAPEPALAARTVRVKGAGAVVVSLVRERAGAIAFDPPDVRASDRWKIQLTCDPGGGAWVDVVVYQAGGAGFPLPAQRIACGNAVVVPGAFRITDGGADLCVAVAATAPDRGRLDAGDRRGAVCATLAAGE